MPDLTRTRRDAEIVFNAKEYFRLCLLEPAVGLSLIPQAHGGALRGTVRASHRVDVQASATLRGTITTPRLKVEEGTTLDVELCMSESRTLPNRSSHTQKLAGKHNAVMVRAATRERSPSRARL